MFARIIQRIKGAGFSLKWEGVWHFVRLSEGVWWVMDGWKDGRIRVTNVRYFLIDVYVYMGYEVTHVTI